MFPKSHVESHPSYGVGSILDKQAWHQSVEKAVAQSKSDGSPLAVIFMDVNYFKEVNDTLGHVAGDEVIADIRNLLTDKLRIARRPGNDNLQDLVSISDTKPAEIPDDYSGNELLAGHIGGDEFGLLCKTDDSGTDRIVRRLRSAFNEYLETQDEKLRNLDISLAIGASVLQPDMDSSELLMSADKEMYEDKLRQLPPLNEQQIEFLVQMYQGLEQHNLRLRDMGKYAIVLSRKV